MSSLLETAGLLSQQLGSAPQAVSVSGAKSLTDFAVTPARTYVNWDTALVISQGSLPAGEVTVTGWVSGDFRDSWNNLSTVGIIRVAISLDGGSTFTNSADRHNKHDNGSTESFPFLTQHSRTGTPTGDIHIQATVYVDDDSIPDARDGHLMGLVIVDQG